MRHFILRLLVTSLTLVLAACGPRIVSRPITFDQDRLELSRQYMKDRYGIDKPQPVIQPVMVVLHWTEIPTLEGSYRAFSDSRLPNTRSEISGAGALNVSAHFLIDRDGTIYQLMPETLMARHVIGLNHCAIGVENVGGTQETPLTTAQLKANISLARYLSRKYAIAYVIGHHEYRQFEGHRLWLERDRGYRTVKSDPGDDFMKLVRDALKDKRN